MAATKKYLPDIHNLRSPRDIMNFYKEFSSHYENEMGSINFQSHQLVANAVFDLNISTEAKIIDIGAGTGLVAKVLRSRGYTNIDALDCTKEMIEIARKENLYRNYIEAVIGEYGSVTQIQNDTYDVVTCAGVFCANHLCSKAFPELIRFTKPGGVIIMIRGLQYGSQYPELGQDFMDDLEKLIADGKWKRRVEDIYAEEYIAGVPGLINVMDKK